MLLSLNHIREAERKGFFVFRTREGWEDLLITLKTFIQQESGYHIPDGIKLERKVIKHILENHGYDSELWWWTSITYEHFMKIPEILSDYDHCEKVMFTEDSKEHIRFHLKKSYGSDYYHLVVEILQENVVINQLWIITLYINDVVWESKYLQAKQRGMVKKCRARIREECNREAY